ncbi:MAG: ATP-binding protein [Candidatus Omnitrophica bacterium]|nr:ATP-binding protein [Candidatus Omnitrophota bacterium]
MLFSAKDKQIDEIITVLNNIGSGEPGRRTHILSSGKITELAEAINKAVSALEEKINLLEKEKQQALTILNNMVEGVVVVDNDSRIKSLNPSAKRIFNVPSAEVVGRLLLEAFRNNGLSEIAADVLKNGKVVLKELNVVWPEQRVFQVNASPIFEKNIASGCLLVIHDVTEMRKLETMRRDFVANVSHELKTPLTSIKGFVETLLEGAIDDKENNLNFLKIIQNHAQRLDNLVNDLLDLSYVESKEASINKENINLKEISEEMLLSFKSKAKKKNIEVKNELPSDVLVVGDKGKIGQVFTNLIDNAVKFNKENGFVRIYCEEMKDKLKVIVEDSGVGIPRKDLLRIFERFYRVDKARSRELGGTGLGLSIVKHIIELHGGEAGVESVEGSGSKFWFTLLRG